MFVCCGLNVRIKGFLLFRALPQPFFQSGLGSSPEIRSQIAQQLQAAASGSTDPEGSLVDLPGVTAGVGFCFPDPDWRRISSLLS